MTPVEKIKARIEVNADDCWIWAGAKTWKGYGRVYWQGRGHYTHRLMFEAVSGPIPAHKQIDHLCRNPSCCNPAHLEAVEPRENTMRGRSVEASHERKGSAVACPHGHRYAPQNSYIDARGYRSCRACRKARHDALTQVRRTRRYRAVTAQGGNVASIMRGKNA